MSREDLFSADHLFQEKGLTETPLPWEQTRELLRNWEKGPETKLYRDMDLYH